MRRSCLRHRFPAIILAISVLALAGSASAEIVLLTDGTSYTGTVTVTAHTVIVASAQAKGTIDLPGLKSIELDAQEQIQYEIERKKLNPKDAGANYKLGAWLKSRFQYAEAREYFRKAIELDPNHAEARRELGYERKDGAWAYSPVLEHQSMHDWVGAKSYDFHVALAKKLAEAKAAKEEEAELRRAVQADQYGEEAVNMLRPLLAGYKTKNKYRLPFEGTWTSTWGRHSHYSYMMYAWDFLKVDDEGRYFVGDWSKIENHYTYNAPVYACADGVVYDVRADFPDNPVGQSGGLLEGNRVRIHHANGENSVIGHLKKGTVAVKVGDKVKQGQFIARISSNGHSVRPHIHFAVYDADGVSFPITFYNFDLVKDKQHTHAESGLMEPETIYYNSFNEPARK